MWEAPKPIVGRINGAARAGGLGLVAACDIAVAAGGGDVRPERGADRRRPGDHRGRAHSQDRPDPRDGAVPHRRRLRREGRRHLRPAECRGPRGASRRGRRTVRDESSQGCVRSRWPAASGSCATFPSSRWRRPSRRWPSGRRGPSRRMRRARAWRPSQRSAPPLGRRPIRAHLLRWRPRLHAQRTESTPRVQPSGAASHLDPSRPPAALGKAL